MQHGRIATPRGDSRENHGILAVRFRVEGKAQFRVVALDDLEAVSNLRGQGIVSKANLLDHFLIRVLLLQVDQDSPPTLRKGRGIDLERIKPGREPKAARLDDVGENIRSLDQVTKDFFLLPCLRQE